MKKSFTYTSVHVPALKRCIVWAIIFMTFMLALLVLQSTIYVKAFLDKEKISLTRNIYSIIAIFLSFSFILIQLASISKNCAIIKHINRKGSANSFSILYNFNDKHSFAFAYKLINYISLSIMCIFTTGMITYAVWQYILYAKVIYFIPLIVIVLLITYASCKDIDNKQKLEKII